MSEGKSTPRPRLFIDMSIIARRDAGTGIQRVARSLWQTLKMAGTDDFEIVPLAGAAKGAYRRIPDNFLEHPLERLPWRWGRGKVSPREGDVFLGLDLSLRVVTRNAAQLRRWRARGVTMAFMVYDLLPDLRPEWFTDKARDFYQTWLGQIVRESDLLVCISDTVASDLKRWISARQTPCPKIATVRLAGVINQSLSSSGMPTNASATIAWASSGTCVLMVGTIEPRKGYEKALAAFETLWRHSAPGDDFKLLIVGRAGWKTEALQQQLRDHPLSGSHLRWIDDASDQYLEHLYSACWGLLVASRGEGLGLPLLEAAALAKPVLARDLPVFREIACEGVAFFDDDTAAGLSAAIRAWKDAGIATRVNTEPYSWSDTAEELKAIICELRSQLDTSASRSHRV